MSHLFEVSITTAGGNAKWSQRANSVQQLKDCLPPVVQIFEATLVPLSGDSTDVDGDEIAFEMSKAVSDINYANSCLTT